MFRRTPIRELDRLSKLAYSRLAPYHFFFYAPLVKTSVSLPPPAIAERIIQFFWALIAVFVFCSGTLLAQTEQSQKPDINTPVVTKVEPPSWWIHLTPEVMLLISGHNLEATRVACNLPSILVERTQAAAGGNYLFVWMEM